MKRAILCLLIAAASPLSAQGTGGSPQAGGGVKAAASLWEQITGYITRAAEQMPESDYAYRPVSTVRTFGELIGHIAGAQYMICAAAVGDPARSEDAVEKSAKTKTALIAALKASTQYCGKAYGQSDAAAAAPMKLFGQENSRMFALMLNATHNGEHYGNIVTYMRTKGMVPPSSQPAPAATR